jgi:hypothetical protein
VCDANASLVSSVGAPLLAATFSPRAMRDANAFLDGLFGAPLLAATFSPRAVRDANASLDGLFGVPLVAATFCPRAMCDANASLDGYVGAPIPFAIRTTHLMMNRQMLFGLSSARIMKTPIMIYMQQLNAEPAAGAGCTMYRTSY